MRWNGFGLGQQRMLEVFRHARLDKLAMRTLTENDSAVALNS